MLHIFKRILQRKTTKDYKMNNTLVSPMMNIIQPPYHGSATQELCEWSTPSWSYVQNNSVVVDLALSRKSFLMQQSVIWSEWPLNLSQFLGKETHVLVP